MLYNLFKNKHRLDISFLKKNKHKTFYCVLFDVTRQYHVVKQISTLLPYSRYCH